MSHAKGVVLEKNNNKITVLTTEGVFQTLKYRGNVGIGEEIQLPRQRQTPMWRVGASIAAVFLLMFMGVFGWNAFQPRTAVAMISVDINPSLQLTLDQKGKVLELESLNSDAEQLISGFSFKGKAWEEALNEIIKRSVAMQFLTEDQDWVLVGYSPFEPGQQLSRKTINSEEITKQVQEAVHEQGLKPAVAVYELTFEEKDQARATGLTLGEYALVDTAQKAGLAIKPEAVKEKEERSRLLETPEVLEQMKKDKRIKDVSPKADKYKGSNSDEYELMGMDKYQENKNNQGKKDMQNPGSDRDKNDDRAEGDWENNRGSKANNPGNDSGKDKVTDQKDKDNKGNNRDNNSNSNDQGKGNKQEKNEPQNNGNNKDKNNDYNKNNNQVKKLKTDNESNQNNYDDKKYKWDFRTVLKLSFLQRG